MAADKSKLEAALLRTMTLLASLSVAAEIRFGMRERKAGRDPSREEFNEVAIHHLKEDLHILKALLFQLQSSLALHTEDTYKTTDIQGTKTVTRFIDLVRLQKAGQVLHRIHQRLLSLYPVVSEFQTEEARLLKRSCDELQEAEDGDFMGLLSDFVERCRHFVNQDSLMLN